MSKYICAVCNKPKAIDTSALQVGDKVNFTVQTIGRNTAGFRSKTGVISQIDGDFCRVSSSGRDYVARLESLTPFDAPNPITWIVGECACGNPESAQDVN